MTPEIERLHDRIDNLIGQNLILRYQIATMEGTNRKGGGAYRKGIIKFVVNKISEFFNRYADG